MMDLNHQVSQKGWRIVKLNETGLLHAELPALALTWNVYFPGDRFKMETKLLDEEELHVVSRGSSLYEYSRWEASVRQVPVNCMPIEFCE